MDRQTSPRYPHRRNADGSHDSICTVCFVTVASAREESELTGHEQAHVCNPYWSGLVWPESESRFAPDCPK